MVSSPRRNFLLLLCVLCSAVVTGYFLKTAIVGDFRKSLEEERRGSVRLIASDLEGSYERSRAWNREDTAAAAVQALMLGMRVTVKDASSGTVMNTDKALSMLPPERKASGRCDSLPIRSEQSIDEQLMPLVMGQGEHRQPFRRLPEHGQGRSLCKTLGKS